MTSLIHGAVVPRRLTARRALVTGGSRGIGAQIVRHLAADGAAVAFTYRVEGERAERVAADVKAHGGTAIAIQADSARHEDVGHAMEQALSQLGGLDILVNNAGIAHVCPVESFPLEQYDRMMAVNVRAAFLAVRAAVPHLSAGGRIITIGSVNADRVPIPGLSVYSATKAAVAGLTRGLARELGPRGITVNLVQPGPIDTDMNPKDGEFASSAMSFIALGRYGQPRDVAAVVSFLASKEAEFVTGAVWNVDGGSTV